MANGLMYPTGVSTEIIDVSSGAKAFMQSAIESRINEIRESKKEISKNQENILKAMSVKALPELARAQRDRYDKEINDYRNRVRDIWKESDGKLTTDQLKEIQDGRVDLEAKMLSEVNELKQIDSLKKMLLDPRTRDFYDTDKVEQILGKAYSNVEQGKGAGDVSAELFRSMKPLSVSDIAYKRFSKDIEGLDIMSGGEVVNGVFRFTSKQKEQEVDDLVDYVFRNDPDLERRDTPEERERLKQTFIQENSEVKQAMRTGSSRTSGDRNKNAIDFTHNKTEIEGEEFELVDVPTSIPQSERIKTITSGRNITTRKPLDGAVKAELVGVNWKKKTGVFRGIGGKATKGGEVAYIEKGTTPIGESGDWTAFTEKDINKSTFGENYLKGKYAGGRPIEEVKNITKTKNEDGSITVKGTIVYDKKGLWKGSGEEEVSITYEPFTDPKSEAYYEAPIKKTDVANWYGKALIDGKDPDYYFSGEQTETSQSQKPKFDPKKFK